MISKKMVGATSAEWQEDNPLKFSFIEYSRSKESRQMSRLDLNFTDLQAGFTINFLLNLKDVVIEWRFRISLNTIKNYIERIQHLFRIVISYGLFDRKIDVIDEAFLSTLQARVELFPSQSLQYLRIAFKKSHKSSLWRSTLQCGDFPRRDYRKDYHGEQIKRIMHSALSRSECVQILERCERAYHSGKMDIGHFSFANLSFSIFCRPDSYRQIRISDLIIDQQSNSYFLQIIPVKTRVKDPKKIIYRINEPIGKILQKQRQNVVNQYAHLVSPDDIPNLALFPARRLHNNNTAWLHEYANQHQGMYEDAEIFMRAYPREIQRLYLAEHMNIKANTLRHTVGTQLALTGASSKTIQAVLKHSTDAVCKAYVDIAFNGMIDTLSEAMQPAFDKYFPIFKFRSKYETISPEQAIHSNDEDLNEVELTGECGSLIKCEYAPISCYGCSRFIPCWDADHSINLKAIENEIEDFRRRGKTFQHMVEKALQAKLQIEAVIRLAGSFKSGSKGSI